MRKCWPLGLAVVTVVSLGFLLPSTAPAAVRLPGVIGENMVLQQGAAVPLWGWADEGEVVTVKFQGQKVSATAKGGKWKLQLAPLKPGGPYAMVIAGANTIELKNVLVGEVWVSCGQSNMMMSLAQADTGAKAIAEANNFPDIRLFNVANEARSDTVKDDVQGNWVPATSQTVGGFSAVSYFFGRELSRQLKTPIGLINAVAIMPAEAWVDANTLQSRSELNALLNDNALKAAGRSYNSMIAPLQPYAIKGAIYYQGEYNAGRARQFRSVMPAVIQSWRKTWGQGDFPFLFVQLPAFGEHKAAKDKRLDMPAEVLTALHRPGSTSAWAELREAQLRTWQTVPNTGMAIAVDVGDAQDIHPVRKQPVGERLALLARAIAYGQKLVFSGPVFDSATAEGSRLVVTFKHVGGGLKARGSKLEGFEIAGADQKYAWADAKIEGDRVTVSSPQVPAPAFLRYAWADYPRSNLFNAEGLPACPFRTIVPGRACQVDSYVMPFRNGSFEEPGAGDANTGGWVLTGGALRTDAKASDGKWSVRLPSKASIAEDGIIPGDLDRGDWTSDLLSPYPMRPGFIAGYSVDIASSGGPKVAYMRLCGTSSASGWEFWGGIPNITSEGERFVTRRIATCMQPAFTFPGSGGISVGGLFANNDNKEPGDIYLDHFTPITVILPRLGISDTNVIALGPVRPGATATSARRLISNLQSLTLPCQLGDSTTATQVATVLYGLCNAKTKIHWGFEHACIPTDNVGAKILGPDANRFRFVSSHLGANPRELRLIGSDGKEGLAGGKTPESEELTVLFAGADKPGIYSAVVRVVTQAGNLGIPSRGAVEEPLENLFYVDIPVKAQVRQ